MKKILIGSLSVTLFILGFNGCSVKVLKEPIRIAGLAFVNKTNDAITDIKLRVSTSGEFVGANYIPKYQTFSTTFPLREYQENPVIISWRTSKRLWQVGPLLIEPDSNIQKDQPVSVIIELGEAGHYQAVLRN